MQRQKAVEMLERYVTTEHIKTHSLAVECVMKSLALKFAPEDIEKWAITGLLHDLDNDVCGWQDDMGRHGPKTVEILKSENFGDDQMYHAILAHNKATGIERESIFDKALYAADPITGFITAIALVYPDKKLASVKLKSITKRMKEKRFAAGADREAMMSIEELGISFEEFAQLALDAMNEISDELGL